MSEARAAAITRDIMDAFARIVEKHNLTQDEYRAGVVFLAEAADKGEAMLLPDALFEHAVVKYHSDRQKGTHGQVLGPYHVPDSPRLDAGRLAGEDEPGVRLEVEGRVLDTVGQALAGAELDFWQANAEGFYSNFDAGTKPGNLRGRIRSADNGAFRLETVVPAAYAIPHDGPTGRLLEILGRHPWRPAHIHLIASHEGHRTLTTQIYFEGDPYLDSDSVRAARPELAFPLVDAEGGKRVEFDIVLEPT